MSEPVLHDHTQLEVLFSDLRDLLRYALHALPDRALLEDAAQTWRTLVEELIGHFGREEARIFHAVIEARPEHRPTCEILMAQHVQIIAHLQALGEFLDPAAALEHLRQQFEERWLALQALWQQHSALEWDLLREFIYPQSAL